MTSIIISLSILFLIYELTTMVKPYDYDKKLQRIKKDLDSNYLNPVDRPFIIFNFTYFIWTLAGLFTTEWPMFLTMIVFSILISRLTKYQKSDIKRVRSRVIDSSISIILLLTILIRYYL